MGQYISQWYNGARDGWSHCGFLPSFTAGFMELVILSNGIS
jgi:hypothetical protein